MHHLHKAIIFIGLLTAACNNSSSNGEAANRKNGFTPALKTREDSLYHEVMQGHDMGMAKIGKLRQHMDEVQHKLDSLHKLPASKTNNASIQTLIALQATLKTADNEMSNWMDQFKVDSATNDPDLRVRYLQQEKEKVSEVKAHILNGLQEADSVLKK